jgi:hypothetical protein
MSPLFTYSKDDRTPCFMLFRSYKPSPPLSDFIESFWLYDGYEFPHLQERIFPSGTFEMVFNLRDNELRIYKAEEPDPCHRFSGAIVSGPYNGFFVTDTAEEASVMGVHFRQGGAFPFLGLAANELADIYIDLDTAWGRWATEVRERLSAARSPARRFRLLEQSLFRLALMVWSLTTSRPSVSNIAGEVHCASSTPTDESLRVHVTGDPDVALRSINPMLKVEQPMGEFAISIFRCCAWGLVRDSIDFSSIRYDH